MSKKIPDNIYEVSLRVNFSENVELYKEQLIHLGISEEEIVQLDHFPYTYLSVYSSNPQTVRSLKKKLKTLKSTKVKIQFRSLKKEDWQTKWKDDFRPFQLTRRFDVVPILYKNKFKSKKREPIYIDTSVAFGTGLHETTRFMAQLIEYCQDKFQTFLDVGTGTGILAIIAVKCGAFSVKAIDIDADAIKIARSNMHINGLDSKHFVAADVNSVNKKEQYDFVAANLITQDLIRLASKLISFVKPHGYLAVSGISIRNYDFFRKKFPQATLRCIKVQRGKEWVAILFKRLK